MSHYQVIDTVYLEMLNSKALRDRTVVINEDITTESVYKVAYFMDKIKKIDDLENKKPCEREIIIELSSGGGSCMAGYFLCSKILKFIEEYGYNIITRVNEDACSMAFLIFVMGSQREMYRFSEIMFHQPLSGSWGYEKLGDMEERKEHLYRMWDRMKSLVSEKTKITDEQMEECKKCKLDWYMTADEALKLGCCDKII